MIKSIENKINFPTYKLVIANAISSKKKSNYSSQFDVFRMTRVSMNVHIGMSRFSIDLKWRSVVVTKNSKSKKGKLSLFSFSILNLMEGTKQFNFDKKLSTSTVLGITAKTSSTFLYQTNSKSTTDGNKSLSKWMNDFFFLSIYHMFSIHIVSFHVHIIIVCRVWLVLLFEFTMPLLLLYICIFICVYIGKCVGMCMYIFIIIRWNIFLLFFMYCW